VLQLRVGLIALFGLATFQPLAAGETMLEFKTPRHLSTAVGESTLELSVYVPDGAEVDRIELFHNDEPLITLTAPPWQANWDAGDAIRGQRLKAVLYLTDGRQAEAFVTTSPLRINQFEEVGLVNLYALVRDGKGAYVSDLTRDDFSIHENGTPQAIKRFSTERKPLRVGIVLDTSLSMSAGKGTKLKNARSAALEFLDALQPGDEGMVVTFNDHVTVAQDLTKDKKLLAEAIVNADSKGGTALYDAIWRASRKLEDFDGRRVMVVLSDGRDESYEGLQPGSLHTLEEALDQALRSEVMVFTIGLGRRLDHEYVIRWDYDLYGQPNVDTSTSLGEILRRIADATGGRALISSSAGHLRRAFKNVAEDLRNQYLIAYVSSDEHKDGGWREIGIATKVGGYEVIARKGYYAPSETDPALRGIH